MLVLGVLVRYSVLQPLDQHVSTEAQEHTGAFLDALMLGATFLGSAAFVGVATAAIALGLWVKGLRHAAVYFAFTMLSLPFVLGLKEIWARARPDEKVFHVTGSRFGYSFPSGHTLMGTAFYGALAVLCWVHFEHTARRRVSTAAFALVPLAIGLSRIYLGAHWVSDVLGGYLGGLILLFVLTSFYLAQLDPPREPKTRPELSQGA